MFKLNVDSKNAKKKCKKKKKIDKNILVSELIASKMAAVNCLYFEGNTCHGHSMP